MNRSTSVSLTVFGALLATACGGSSTSDPLVGLAPPASLSLVEPLGEDTPGGSFVAPGASSYPIDSAYVTDLQDVHVFDPSLEPLTLINTILCAVGQTAASDMINEAPYIAQIDFEACANGGGDSSSTDPSSSGSADTFELWRAESTRLSNTADQITQIWIPAEDINDQEIQVEMTLSEGASTTNPFGVWGMVYAGIANGETAASPGMYGSLATLPSTATASGFDFYEVQGDISVVPASNSDARESLVTVELSADLSTGQGRVVNRNRENYSGDTGIIEGEYLVAFDETHFLRETVTAGTRDGGKVFHRDQVTENVWRYGLYYADGVNVGDRVEVSSGFGIQNEDGDYGYIGYYGIWGSEEADFSNGTPVTSESYDADPVEYTVFRAPGKLVKNVRSELNTNQIAGMLFDWPSQDGSGDPVLYRVSFNFGTGQWLKEGVRDYSSESFTPIDPVEVIDTSVELFLDMWSRELGGSASFVHGDTFISYFTRETVIGSPDFFGLNQTLELFGLVQCLDSGITAIEGNEGDIYLPDAGSVASPYRFEFDRDTMALQYDSDGVGTMVDVGMATGETITTGPNTWGLSSGPLVTSLAGLTNTYDIWGVSEYYYYETGPNDWNVYSGVKDDNDVLVAFDPPLTFRYRHDEENDRNEDNSYDGRTYILEYQGSGNLSGIPSVGVDLTGDSNPNRYYPAFGMKDGTLVGDNDQYVVKAIDVEQQLLEDMSYAGSLTLTGVSTMTLPDKTAWVAPTNGTMPVVTDAPRVIDGELQ